MPAAVPDPVPADHADRALFPGFACGRVEVGGLRLHVCRGGASGRPPLLLLHGFPQTHAIWHRLAADLAARHTLVMPDLRGYGDSDKPAGGADHAAYSKRTMAAELVALMTRLGHPSFDVCGHDRGGRVAHRMALDHPGAVRRLLLLDISPTATMYSGTDMAFARAYYHWFFLIQPAPLPETLIGAAPGFYLRAKLGAWGAAGTGIFDPRALAEYQRCFADPAAIHAMCEDYRAAAGIDLEHDAVDAAAGRLVEAPLRVLWGERGVVGRLFAPLADWQARARPVVGGRALPCGHYLAEEAPAALLAEMSAFFA